MKTEKSLFQMKIIRFQFFRRVRRFCSKMRPQNPKKSNFFGDFTKFCAEKSISLIVRALWGVQEVESYALSKFQPSTTLGDSQNVEKTIRKKFYFGGSRKSAFRNFSWILEELNNFRCQNRFPRQILLQIHLF